MFLIVRYFNVQLYYIKQIFRNTLLTFTITTHSITKDLYNRSLVLLESGINFGIVFPFPFLYPRMFRFDAAYS
jgi:hypothetical protein